MPRVLLVVVAFAAAATALPHQLRRAKPEKSVADAHAPTRRMPSLAALEADIEELAASMEKVEDGSMDGDAVIARLRDPEFVRERAGSAPPVRAAPSVTSVRKRSSSAPSELRAHHLACATLNAEQVGTTRCTYEKHGNTYLAGEVTIGLIRHAESVNNSALACPTRLMHAIVSECGFACYTTQSFRRTRLRQS